MNVRRLRPLLVLSVAVLLATPLAACTSIPLSRAYLGSTTYGTSVIAPGDWVAYDAAAVLGPNPPVKPAFIEGFGPGVADPTRPMVGAAPGGVLVVNLYAGLDAARAAARNAFVSDLDAAIASGAAVVLQETAPVVDGPWERRSLLLEVRLDPGTVTRVRQETMLGTSPVSKSATGEDLFPVKTLVVGCDPACFAANVEVIDGVVTSWRVE